MSVEGLYGADEDGAAISQLVVVAGGSWVAEANDIVLSSLKKKEVGFVVSNRISIRSGRQLQPDARMSCVDPEDFKMY